MPLRRFTSDLLTAATLLALSGASVEVSAEASDRPCIDLCIRESLNHEFTPKKPVQTWLDWEFKPSIPGLNQEFPSSRIPLSLVPVPEVTILRSSHLPKEVEALFLRGDRVLWPKHPYNRVESTPFFKAPELPDTLKAFHTASRSMVAGIGGHLYGIKMPTNHPFGPSRVEQMNKAFPKDSMRSSMRRTAIIEKIDQKIGADPDLIFLKDILTVVETASGHGFSIRDLRPLDNGNLFFPAHLIPVVGDEIAAKSGQNMAEFFKGAWAGALGRFQAKMLVRYGMEYNPINPQNFLIELSPDLKPTGRLAVRDLGDAFQVESVSKAVGLGEEVVRDRELGLKVFAKTEPGKKSETMTWGFNLSGKSLILPVTRESWYSAHDEAFLTELSRLTGIAVRKGYGTWAIEELLEAPENKTKLIQFHQNPVNH